MYLFVCTLLYKRLTVPEENSNDDRHIKKERTNHIVNFFFLFSLCLSLSLPFSFQGNTKKKKRGEKKKEAVHSPTSLSATPSHARSSHHLASRSDHLHILYQRRLLRCHHNFIYYFFFFSHLLILPPFTIIISLSTVSSQHLSSHQI